MSKDYDGEVKVLVHNYGPYVGEKIIIDIGEEGLSLDLQSLPQLIKDLQKVEKNLEYYLERDQTKDNMLEEMWKKRDLNPSNEREIEKEYETKVTKFYEKRSP
jgi:hypothetical protein